MQRSESRSPTRLFVWSALFLFAWYNKQVLSVFNQGILRGPDDYMRLHQVRNWLEGNAWFDFSMPRFFPPLGADMHWPRLIDVPIGALIFFFDLFTTTENAERIAVIVWPFLLFILTVFLLTEVCRKILPQINPLLPLLFFGTSFQVLGEFIPGRIDHHNVQILLMVTMLLGLVNANTRWGYPLSMLAIALSLGIGQDSMIVIALLLVWLVMEWVLQVDEDGSRLMKAGIALMISALGVFLLTVSPSNWWVPACDAMSVVYLSVLELMALSFLVLAVISKALRGTSKSSIGWKRFGAAAIVGLAVLGVLYVSYPQCLTGPLASMSEELKVEWLSNVSEARGLFASAALHPEEWISQFGYFLFISLAGGILTWQLRHTYPRIIPLYVVFLASFFAALVQVRVMRLGMTAAVPLCMFIVYFSWTYLQKRFEDKPHFAKLGTGLIGVLVLSITWNIAGNLLLGSKAVAKQVEISGTEIEELPEWAKTPNSSFCSSKQDLAFLNSLPKGLVMNQTSLGPAILVHTHHAISGADYHRNEQAILNSMRFFVGNNENAKTIAYSVKANYVVYCQNLPGKKYANAKPGQLQTMLGRGQYPQWLRLVSPEKDRLLVFELTDAQ